MYDLRNSRALRGKAVAPMYDVRFIDDVRVAQFFLIRMTVISANESIFSVD